MRVLLAAPLVCGVAIAQDRLDKHFHPLRHTNATFGWTQKPFELKVDPKFIEDVRKRVEAAWLPEEPENLVAPGSDGPPVENATIVQEYWAKTYDWAAVQAGINRRLKQFTTLLPVRLANHTRSVPLHFVHHRSAREDAIPLLFVHGWPGSFLEVENIIDLLTNPPNASVPAFHVVAPSIPGFGFSPAPAYDGFGPEEAADAFNSLMYTLNYTQYVYQGGDFGGTIFPYIATQYPENVVSGLSNFWIVQPNATDLARYAANETSGDEKAYIENIQIYITEESGYRLVQETTPLALAYGLTDSPLGFAMWIYNLMRIAIDPTVSTWTPEQVITWSMMYLIQGPYGGLRMYEMMLREGAFKDLVEGTPPYVHIPVAISEFEHDIWYREPLEWAQRQGNVKARFVHDKGGHFAAWQTPHVLANDIWSWFGSKEASGTKVFDRL